MNLLLSPVRKSEPRTGNKLIELVGFNKEPIETNRWWAALEEYLRLIENMSMSDLYCKGLSICGNKILVCDSRYLLNSSSEHSARVPDWYANRISVGCTRADVEHGLFTFLRNREILQLQIIFPSTEQIVISATSMKRVDIEVAHIWPEE